MKPIGFANGACILLRKCFSSNREISMGQDSQIQSNLLPGSSLGERILGYVKQSESGRHRESKGKDDDGLGNALARTLRVLKDKFVHKSVSLSANDLSFSTPSALPSDCE
jgi:hypothetical protein